MKFILVVLIVAGFVCVILSFLVSFAKYLPFVWDREEWKIWKECWSCDVVGYEDKEFVNTKTWCAAVINDFDGDVTFEVVDDNVHVVGKGNKNFFSVQSGF